jgi:hypothetical protein
MAIILKNQQLQLDIQEPGTQYVWPRFDWTGQIRQVTYKDTYTFCSRETHNPWRQKKRGTGLSNEFGIEQPIGYDDAQPGDRFPKIGVGLLLKRAEKHYRFFKNYDNKPFHISVSQSEQTATFVCRDEEIRGYAAFYTKNIALDHNKFTIDYEMKNTGTRPVITTEYCHNFVAINNENIGPDYLLHFPFALQPSKFAVLVNHGTVCTFQGHNISWKSTPTKEFFIRQVNPAPLQGGSWALEHTRHKVGIRETCSFPVDLINLWGKKHVVSPEIFYNLSLAPGETAHWQRVYEVYEC